jgi:hypothetical protein
MSKQTDQAKKDSSEEQSPIRDAVVPKPDQNREKEPVPPQQGYNDKDRSMVDDLIEQGVKAGVDTIINPSSGTE